jgi:hypothetical protein
MPTVPTQIAAGNLAQNPLRAGGVLGGQNTFKALASFQVATGGLPAVGRIIASGGTPTGIPATAAFPGFGATLVGPGLYAISFPPFQNGTINPVVSAPSMAPVVASWLYQRGFTQSGIARLQVGVGSGITNLPTGSVVDLEFWVAPRNDQGLVRF